MSADRDKDSLTDEKSTDSMPTVNNYLSKRGFDLIGHSSGHGEKVASSALDDGE